MTVPEHAIDKLDTYARARCELLRSMGCTTSCRDPLSEFAEWLVKTILGASSAPSRVQKGYDLTDTDGRRIQVKYLANPASDRWINGHHIIFSEEMDQYALVVFEEFKLTAVLIFDRNSLFDICKILKKRHPNQEHSLQLTKRDFTRLLETGQESAINGLQVYRPTPVTAKC